MRVIPFLLVLIILIGGVVVAFQTFNEAAEDPSALAVRPTVTPRPWPTPPPRPASPTFAADPFQPSEPNQANAASGLQSPPQAQLHESGPIPMPTPGVPPSTQTPVAPSPGTPVASQNTPTVATAEATLFVGNTGGEGVYLRATPRMDDTLSPWPENTPMVVIGSRVEGDGHMWERVRAPDGSEGYIPAEYLVGRP